MDYFLILWLVLLIVFVIAEIATVGLTTIWFAGGALVAIFLALAGMPFFVQMIAFLVVSLVLLFCTRPLAMNYFNRERVKTNVDDLVGKQAIVLTDIDNLQGTGQVSLNGMEWTARAWEEGKAIPEGAVVTVKAIQGVKLLVEERKL